MDTHAVTAQKDRNTNLMKVGLLFFGSDLAAFN